MTTSKRKIIASDKTFTLPFGREYWSCAVAELSSVKRLCIAGMFIAIRLALSRAYIPISVGAGTQRIFLNFTVTSLGGIIYGPIFAVMVGATSDILGAYLFPNGAFFIGYTLTQLMGDFIYAMFFYRARLSVVRIAFAKLSVSVTCNIVLNAIWIHMTSSADKSDRSLFALMLARIPKNVTLFPFEVAILVVFLGVMCKIIYHDGIIHYRCFDKNIKLF